MCAIGGYMRSAGKKLGGGGRRWVAGELILPQMPPPSHRQKCSNIAILTFDWRNVARVFRRRNELQDYDTALVGYYGVVSPTLGAIFHLFV